MQPTDAGRAPMKPYVGDLERYSVRNLLHRNIDRKYGRSPGLFEGGTGLVGKLDVASRRLGIGGAALGGFAIAAQAGIVGAAVATGVGAVAAGASVAVLQLAKKAVEHRRVQAHKALDDQVLAHGADLELTGRERAYVARFRACRREGLDTDSIAAKMRKYEARETRPVNWLKVAAGVGDPRLVPAAAQVKPESARRVESAARFADAIGDTRMARAIELAGYGPRPAEPGAGRSREATGAPRPDEVRARPKAAAPKPSPKGLGALSGASG